MSSVMTGFSGTPWGREVPCIPVNPASVTGTWISMPWGTVTPCLAGACAACTTQWATAARGVGRASTGMRWLPALLGSVHVRTAPGGSSLAAKILPAVKAESGRGCPAGLGMMDGSGYPQVFQNVLCSLAPLPSFPRDTLACRGSFSQSPVWGTWLFTLSGAQPQCPIPAALSTSPVQGFKSCFVSHSL